MTEYKLPEPVAHCQLSIGRKTVAYFDGKPIFMTGPVGNDSHRDPLYTAAQLAAARLQGAEEERKQTDDWCNQFWKERAHGFDLGKRIKELESDIDAMESKLRTERKYCIELEQQLAEKREPLTIERNADKTLEEIVGEIRALKGTK
jgi:predicted RNase H-like nuclease (RuvC/YqgF family)